MKCGTLWMLTLEAQLIMGFSKDTDKKEYQSYLKNGRLKIFFIMMALKEEIRFLFELEPYMRLELGFYLLKFNKLLILPIGFLIGIERIKGVTQESCIPNWLWDAIDFVKRNDHKVTYTVESNQRSLLVDSPYFKTEIIKVEREIRIQTAQLDAFVVLMAVEGDNQISVNGTKYALPFGTTVLLPACLTGFSIQAEQSKVLMVTV